MRSRLPQYEVSIAYHIVARRWPIPAQRFKVSACDEVDAREYAVRIVHAHVGVAPWKPYRRESLRHVIATRMGSPLRLEVVSEDPQLVLFTDEQIAA